MRPSYIELIFIQHRYIVVILFMGLYNMQDSFYATIIPGMAIAIHQSFCSFAQYFATRVFNTTVDLTV